MRRSLLALQCILTSNFAAAAGGAAAAAATMHRLLQYGDPNCPFPAAWEAVADEIAAKLARAPSVRTLQELRGCMYELLAALIPPDLLLLRIIKSLFFLKPGDLPADSSEALLSSSSKTTANSSSSSSSRAAAAAKYMQQRSRRLLLLEVVNDAAVAAVGLQRGSKPIFHLEAFAASAMRRFKAYAEAQTLNPKP